MKSLFFACSLALAACSAPNGLPVDGRKIVPDEGWEVLKPTPDPDGSGQATFRFTRDGVKCEGRIVYDPELGPRFVYWPIGQ